MTKKKYRSIAFILCTILLLFLAGCTDDTEAVGFSAEKIFTETHKTEYSYQGAAVYGKYFFQFSDRHENVGIYDMETKELLSVTSLSVNDLYHCNNVNFGGKTNDDDEFPFLYVSMENVDAHCALVYRINRTNNDFSFTLAQTIIYPDPKKDGVYYPNCMVDGENGFLYVMGYTRDSYKKSSDNNIRVTKFTLPDVAEETVELKMENALDSFTLESVTATQGGLVKNGKIYQVYGFDGSSSFRMIDPEKKEFSLFIRLPKHKFKSEPECLVLYGDDFYCADVHGNVYRFSLQW